MVRLERRRPESFPRGYDLLVPRTYLFCMGTPGPTPTITLQDVLAVFDTQTERTEPLTASEVADELGCTRRTAHKKLDALAERGELESKKPGARSRVWWRPIESPTLPPIATIRYRRCSSSNSRTKSKRTLSSS